MNGSPDRKTSSDRTRGGAALVGALLGGIVGAVVAVNIAIFAGVESGYEAGLSDLFDQRPATGVVVVVVLLLSPLVGAYAALKLRRPSRRS